MNEKVEFFNLTDKIYGDSRGTPIRYGIYYNLYDSPLEILVRTLNFRQEQNDE